MYPGGSVFDQTLLHCALKKMDIHLAVHRKTCLFATVEWDVCQIDNLHRTATLGCASAAGTSAKPSAWPWPDCGAKGLSAQPDQVQYAIDKCGRS